MKTVSFEEQIMPKNEHPSIFSRQMKAIVLIILQIFFATHAVLKIRWIITCDKPSKKDGMVKKNHYK